MTDINSSSIDCICATNSSCQSSIVIFELPPLWNSDFNIMLPYVLPGTIKGCFTIDSLLLSTLECYYSEFCVSVQNYYNQYIVDVTNTEITLFSIHPLVDNQASSRFSPSTPLSIIVKQMMIEQWNASSSFDLYYEACKPTYCVYSYTTRTVSFIELVLKLVSTIGGLTVALRLITPPLVEIGFSALSFKTRRRSQSNYCSEILESYRP
jgi:hypothetical protein